MTPRDLRQTGLLAIVCLLAACGGSTPGPGPTPPPPPPPANSMPVIEGITAQGRRERQPARFADVGDTIDVSATVRDTETPVDELVYQWTATAGTFNGTGRNTTWTAPASAAAPGNVTLTLKVIENYGHQGQPRIYSQEVTSTVTVALHDTAREVGDMAVRFLTEFSKPQSNRDWQDVMRDFNRARCPDPGEYDNERISVEDHIAKFVMNNYQIGAPSVRVAFGSRCEENVAGDACASVPVFWDSTGPNGRGSTRGTDYLAAVYVPADSRWWLCSSRYIADPSFSHPFYSSK
jgi:hypothetical protein